MDSWMVMIVRIVRIVSVGGFMVYIIYYAIVGDMGLIFILKYGY